MASCKRPESGRDTQSNSILLKQEVVVLYITRSHCVASDYYGERGEYLDINERVPRQASWLTDISIYSKESNQKYMIQTLANSTHSDL